MRHSLVLFASLVLGGCFSDPADSDPYSGMDCEEKIEAIVLEVQEFEAAQGPAPKVSGSATPVIGTNPVIQWIPPVGFTPDDSSTVTLPDTSSWSAETTPPSTLPKSISAVQVVTRSAYVARIRIYDRREELIRTFDQMFGFHGELDNPHRMVPNGVVSYLVWDNKDASGRTVPSGVYLWRVQLLPDSGPEVELETLIGYIGEECNQAE